MNRLFFSILFSLFFSFLSANIESYYHKVEAQKGDGILSLLRRYDLVDEPCNIRQFYKLNHLDKNDQLLIGKKYYIPVLIYKFNGQSIRSSIGQSSWDRAIAIQEYNNLLLKKGLRKSSYQDSKLLWVPFSILYCSDDMEALPKAVNVLENETKKSIAQNRSNDANSEEVTENSEHIVEKIAPAKSFKTDPIFGLDFAKYEEVDQSLKDRVFYIVSGHGGPDPGAMCTSCPSQLCEDEYAYDVSLRLARNLKQHGAQVEIIIQDKNDGIRKEKYLKCDKDEKCMGNQKIPLNQKARLAQRTNAINLLYKDYKKKGFTDHTVIVVHVDARSSNKRQDVFFYHHEKSTRGKTIAENIQKTFREKYERFQKSRGYRGTVKPRGLYIIRNTLPPTVFIELANIKNPMDQKRLILDSNRQALANWIFLGLTRKD